MKLTKEEAIAVWGSLMGGLIAAHLIAGSLSLWFLACLLLISGLLFGLWHLFVWGLCAVSQREVSDSAHRLGEIISLKIDDARNQAEEALKDTSVFTCVEADEKLSETISRLGGHTSEVFARYRQIRILGQETVLGWDQIADSEYVEGLTRIGGDMDFIEYAVRPGADEVFELDKPQRSIRDRTGPLYPTIYHLILTVYEPWRK